MVYLQSGAGVTGHSSICEDISDPVVLVMPSHLSWIVADLVNSAGAGDVVLVNGADGSRCTLASASCIFVRA